MRSFIKFSVTEVKRFIYLIDSPINLHFLGIIIKLQ